MLGISGVLIAFNWGLYIWAVNAEQQATPQQITSAIEFVRAGDVPAVFCESTVSELADHYDMSFAAVRKHVNVLEEAGLISDHRIGRERRIRGDVDAIRRAQSLLDGFEDIWRGRIDRLDALLAEEQHHA